MKPATSANRNMENKKSSKSGKAGRYNLIKGSQKKLSAFCTMYQALHTDKNQVWHAKHYGMANCLQYNQQVLQECKQMQNIICMKQIFILAGNTFIIQQKYDRTLQQFINQSYPLDSGTIQDILSDVLSGLVQIYKQKYFTRNLRMEHIVCVDDVWKIQSFVLDSQIHNVPSQYAWSQQNASPEDRRKQNQLPQEQLDEQLVWNLATIGLQMILGPQFSYSRIYNDTSIPWPKVKQRVGSSMYNFLTQALKTNFKQRMKLKDLLSHQLFAHVCNQKQSPFLSFDKFFGNQNQKLAIPGQQKLNLTWQDQQNLKNLRDDIERFKYFGQVEKYIQQLPFKNNFDINLIRYLSFKICYDNLIKIKNQISVWKRQNNVIRMHQPVKVLENDLQKFLQIARDNKIKCSKNIKGFQMAKSQVQQIKNVLDYEINDETISYTQVVNLYMRLSGSIYSIISRQCDGTENSHKQRTVCYYSLGAYLVHYYQTQKFLSFSSYHKNGNLQLTRLIEKAPVQQLISLTQKLIKQYFAITN